jgi:hypothetical protein
MGWQLNSRHHPTSNSRNDQRGAECPEDENQEEEVCGGTGVIRFSGVRAYFLRGISSHLEMRFALEKDGILGSDYSKTVNGTVA